MTTRTPTKDQPIRVLAATPVRSLELGTGVGIHRIVIDVEQVAVGSARHDMPGLIRASAESKRAFLIKNARNPLAAEALLVNPDVLREHLASARPTRMLSELIESLPFRRSGSTPRLAAALPDDTAPELRLPRARR